MSTSNFDQGLKELLSVRQEIAVAPTVVSEVSGNIQPPQQHQDRLELVLRELLNSREENILMKERPKQRELIKKAVHEKEEEMKRERSDYQARTDALLIEMKEERRELLSDMKEQQQRMLGKIFEQQTKHEQALENVLVTHKREIDSLKTMTVPTTTPLSTPTTPTAATTPMKFPPTTTTTKNRRERQSDIDLPVTTTTLFANLEQAKPLAVAHPRRSLWR